MLCDQKNETISNPSFFPANTKDSILSLCATIQQSSEWIAIVSQPINLCDIPIQRYTTQFKMSNSIGKVIFKARNNLTTFEPTVFDPLILFSIYESQVQFINPKNTTKVLVSLAHCIKFSFR